MKRSSLFKALVISSTLFSLVLYFQACGQIGNFKSGGVSDLSNGSNDLGSVDLQSQTLQVMTENCASCHNAQGFSGTAFTYADNLNQLAVSKYITPGNPDTSLLYQRISEGTMPPGRPLTADKARVLADWILSLKVVPTPTPAVTPTPTPVATSTPNPVNPMAKYSYLSQNIFPRCTKCHGNSGGYSVATYNSTIKALAKGMPDSSLLYRLLYTGAMPKGGPRLTDQELKAVYDWILVGAPNN